MKVTFISNFLNHHQLPFSKAMNDNKEIEYYFIANEVIPEERLQLGYEDMNSKYSFVIEAYKNEKEKQRALKIARESDVVIIGSAPDIYIRDRIKNNLLTFKYSERFFKKSFIQILNPRIILWAIKNRQYVNKKIYMLCASAYAAYDFSLLRTYIHKCFKWGYFPETIQYNIEQLLNCKNKDNTIKLLWVARFIDWKHPELVIELAKYLKNKNYKFKIQMIGCGELEDNIKYLIEKDKLQDMIELKGAIKSNEVRKYMEQSNIFLATSDQNEGWGAVVNEAMNSGCVVVGNKKIGSIPYMIKDKENGLIYSNKNEFFEKVEYAINNKREREEISINAYNTIQATWNANNAVEKFIELSNALLNNQVIELEDGPCSKHK